MKNNGQTYDVIIIGAGASGLMAAITCKRKNINLEVAVLERNDKIGKKLLATGNGRCNLTNMNISPDKYYGSFNPQDVINAVTPQRLIERFDDFGLVCREEKDGLVYPYSKQASAVVEVLTLKCRQSGIEIICGCEVNLIKKEHSGFDLRTALGNFNCKKLIVCTGGKASPLCGGTGSGLDLLRNLGHTVVPASPALCPVETTNKSIKTLKGVRVGARVSLFDGDKLIKSEKGEVQFTENALSGICVFNLSSEIKYTRNPEIVVSLMPENSFNEIFEMLYKRKEIFGDENIEFFFAGLLNKKIALAILKECNISLSCSCSALIDNDIKNLSHIINNLRFDCKKPTDYTKAQVMSGGVSGNDVNFNTLESELVKNLFICGEALDINGDCGGFNLHFAFASGIIAGENI